MHEGNRDQVVLVQRIGSRFFSKPKVGELGELGNTIVNIRDLRLAEYRLITKGRTYVYRKDF